MYWWVIRFQLHLSGKSIPGTLRTLLREPIMSSMFSVSRVVCWLGLKVPHTSLASSLLVAMPAQPVSPSLPLMSSLISAAMCEPKANLGWSWASSSAPGQEKKHIIISVGVKTYNSTWESKSKPFMRWRKWECNANILINLLAFSLLICWFQRARCNEVENLESILDSGFLG